MLVGSPLRGCPGSALLGQERRRSPSLAAAYRGFVRLVDRLLRSRGWQPFRATELELADVTMPASQLVAGIVVGCRGRTRAGVVVRHSLLLGLALAVLVPVGVEDVAQDPHGAAPPRFNAQLDTTLQMIASSLRAGQSFPQALASCARDAEAPMCDELTRIVNEHRIGRDLVDGDGGHGGADGVRGLRLVRRGRRGHRDTGGNLNEIIDRVAQTIRDRTEIREKVHAYASEGRLRRTS